MRYTPRGGGHGEARRADLASVGIGAPVECRILTDGLTKRGCGAPDVTSEVRRPVTPLDPFLSATAMCELLRRRAVSSVELLDAHLRRIARYNPTLNALVTPAFEAARAAAAEADAARSRGEDRPLLGLPVTFKDSINVAGLVTTLGMPEYAGNVSPDDAPVVTRVRAAGGVIVGKTNVPPMLDDFQSWNPIFGRTNNPWDLARTPGGSSGGGAAAVAAALSPLDFGSDFAGSIRVPAAFCGIYGHRPSDTALSRCGQLAMRPTPNPALALVVQGPLARDARDLELAFDVAAGPEAGEDVAWRLEVPPARCERLAGCRVALLRLPDWLPVESEIGAALDALATTLTKAGARVAEAQPTSLGDFRHHYAVFCEMAHALMSMGVPPEEKAARARMFRARGDEFYLACARGVEASAGEFLLLHREREQCRASFRAFFREWDVLLAPITLTAALPHGPMPFPPLVTNLDRTLDVNARRVDYNLQLVLPSVAGLGGQPATAFPVGFTRAGLPLGLQAIGPYLEDRTTIRFAARVAERIGGFRRPPGYEAD